MNLISFPTYSISDIDELGLDHFREMDYFTVENYKLPIELMMENAGLHLATIVAKLAAMSDTILIGIGNGNNGGGGLVAARRLAAWGYNVVLDLPTKITKELPKIQLERALKFGVTSSSINNPAIWVDAYLGFSQRLPLPKIFQESIEQANQLKCIKVSLDIPTGFLGNPDIPYFNVDHVLSLAAAKKVLQTLPASTSVYIADLGIPKSVYKKFGARFPPFNESAILKLEK
jgi:NAD(P)H-hydrate epimerase